MNIKRFVNMEVTKLVILYLFLTVCESRTTVDSDGGYTDILVAISPSIPLNENSSLIIQSLQDLLEKSSEFLFTVTKNHLYFKEINVLAPKQWTKTLSKLKGIHIREVPEKQYNFHSAEIIVDIPNNLYRNQPYTEKFTTCGKYGRYIHITPEYLINKEVRDEFEEPKKMFVRNWSKLRYGIFDEFGFTNDEIYPKFYFSDNETVYPTSCTDIILEGSLLDLKTNSICSSNVSDISSLHDCKFYANNIDNVTSSLMFTGKSNVDSFCDSTDHVHDVDSPNKQNFFCEYKDTWHIIQKSDDMQKVKNPLKRELQINFLIEKEVKDQFAFVVDTSVNKYNFNQPYDVYMSISTLIDQILPSKPSNITYVRYADGADSYFTLSAFFNNLGSSKNISCILCGITSAVKLNANRIILTTTGKISSGDFTKMQQIIEKNSVTLHVIFYPVENMVNMNKWIKLVDKTDGSLTMIQSRDSAISIKLMLQAFMKIFSFTKNNDSTDFTVFDSPGKSKGTLKFNSTKTKNTLTLLCVGTYKMDFNLSCPKTHYPFNSNQKELIIDWYTRIYTHSEKLDGVCTYKLNLYDKQSCVLIQNVMSNKNLIKDKLRVESWINSQNGNVDLVNGALLLNTKLSFQSYKPIIGADVVANILFQPENGSKPLSVKIRLLDNGNGDPDLVLNDGLYSGYCTYPVDRGLYQASFKVTGNNQTYINLYDASTSQNECCGSYVPIENKQKTHFFQFENVLSTVQLQTLVDQDSRIRPSRIGDLKCKIVNHSIADEMFLLHLTWTAPGSYLTHGSAVSYELLISDKKQDLIYNQGNFSKIKLLDQNGTKLKPKESGEKEIIKFMVNSSGLQYLAIQAENEEGLAGKISNIAQVRLMPSIHDKKITGKGKGKGKGKGNGNGNGSMDRGLLISMIGLAVLIFMIFILGVYCVVKRRNKKKEKKKKQSNSKASFSSDKKSNFTVSIPSQESPKIYSIEDTLKELHPENGPNKLNNFEGYDNASFDATESDENSTETHSQDLKNNPNRKSLRRITLV